MRSQPSPESSAALEPHPDAPLRPRASRFRVVADVVYVRSTASLKARQMGYRRRGDAVQADAERGDWVRLAQSGGEAWMLRTHPSLGALLVEEPR